MGSWLPGWLPGCWRGGVLRGIFSSGARILGGLASAERPGSDARLAGDADMLRGGAVKLARRCLLAAEIGCSAAVITRVALGCIISHLDGQGML